MNEQVDSELQDYVESKYNEYEWIGLTDDDIFFGIKNEGSNQIRTKLCTLKQATSWYSRTKKNGE